MFLKYDRLNILHIKLLNKIKDSPQKFIKFHYKKPLKLSLLILLLKSN